MKHLYLKAIIIVFLGVINGNMFAQNIIETKIKDKLPKGVFLREYEKIPDMKVDSYFGIYIENPVIAKVPNEDGFGQVLYYICSERTLGQTISGIYHLFLFQDNTIKSDIIIPPAYSDNITMEQELCYFNTEYNLCWHLKIRIFVTEIANQTTARLTLEKLN
ncbi:MAG: hypothetical protein NTY74_14540 [Ignavibacteriae bacterium]|nr:hypothetical protein [Ignavibacteriota bacterium]